jgi:hypothetical protein
MIKFKDFEYYRKHFNSWFSFDEDLSEEHIFNQMMILSR